LTPNAHRKKSVVISTNGTSSRRSVIGIDWDELDNFV
jgi:hypothetical protein